MSVIDLINIGSTILGLTKDGWLLSWNISPEVLSKEDLKDCPFLQN